MGCYNGTCMISKLPILAGEKIKVLFLNARSPKMKLKGLSTFCYSTDLFTPAFYPFEAEYDDYGGIENVSEDFLRCRPVSRDVIASIFVGEGQQKH